MMPPGVQSPTQTVRLLQAARQLAQGLPADAVLLLAETNLEWSVVQSELEGCRLLVVAAQDPELGAKLHSDEFFSLGRGDWR